MMLFDGAAMVVDMQPIADIGPGMPLASYRAGSSRFKKQRNRPGITFPGFETAVVVGAIAERTGKPWTGANPRTAKSAAALLIA